MDQDDVARVALINAQSNGIVSIDEIDKIAVSDVRGGSVSREGVQRDLLPLIEGTTVATKTGPMKAAHLLLSPAVPFTWPRRPTSCPNCRAACRSASSCAR